MGLATGAGRGYGLQMRPHDEWCHEALVLYAIARRILRMEKAQENGKVAPKVRKRADWWLQKAREAQERHERQAPST